ncbi:uncharacterized protein LOC127857879 isoform X2 [Dreissena polymorpha]|uniref:uncharacterized protein LOC127857879 isoform X2 n=1 Tax=Dreissena polymorpha TaxID=45954 RepID=UPI00226520E5|nr:uncharacterized protein LOC127857879 isoform X2 [Dreissena polymorpha]
MHGRQGNSSSGRPGITISTGVRGHNKVLTPSEGPVLVSTDHDFHRCSLVPSVVLVTEIPRDSKDSFFSGGMHVTTKEKVFSPSSPFRHAAEVIELVRLNDAYSADGLNLRTPIMCLYTDGGPDHRVTYETVKLSLTLIFMHLDLDMLIALRTAPSHSWTNPAERCMSILNLALQHVALDRNEMEEKYEQMVKNLSSLTAVRNQARLKDGLKEAFKKSMEPVVDLVNKRFSQMSLKGNPVKTLKGVSDEEITSILDITGVGFGADSPVATADTKSAELKKSKHLQLFGKALTRDKYRPSTRPCGTYDEELQNHDKENREILRNEKLRDAVLCGECSRPRCVFSPNKLDRQQEEFLRNIKACHSYICGDQLEDAPDLYVRRCVTCSSEVETAYFSAKCRHYLPPVCIHCGSPDCLLDDNDAYVADLYIKYSIVRPICVSCRHSGKEAKTWGAKKFVKKQKVK